MWSVTSSDVNKDSGLKAKGKAKDLDPKAKDLDPKAKTKAQGLESQGQGQGQGRETQGQGQGFGSQGHGQGQEISRSNFSPVFLHCFLLLKCCGGFCVDCILSNVYVVVVNDN